MDCKYFADKKCEDYYDIDQENELGRGSFAIVQKGINKEGGTEVAIKVIQRDQLDEDNQQSLQQEVEIMNQLDHPNVVRLLEIYDEEDSICLVMELMQGGELFDRIVEKESYSEKMASETLKPIVDAIRYCHELGIVHRDLKPENLLYESEDEHAVIKISDFGLARFVEGEYATTACGTPGYIAPEVIEGKGYGQEVDYWSIGIILYVMLCGFPPFYNENNQALFQSILDVQYEFPSPYWDNISEPAKDLIRKLLVRDPKQRLSADQILEHPWIKNEDGATNTLHESIPLQMKEYLAKRRFKKAGHVVMASNKLMKMIEKKKYNDNDQ